jgi:hypothetical protein
MPRPTLAIYGFGYNLNKIVYPWQAMLRSALDLADTVYFNACPSEDDFVEELLVEFTPEMFDGKLKVFDRPWGDHHTVQAHIGNFLLDQIGTDFDYALKMDADEVLCEWSFAQFWGDLTYMRAVEAQLARPFYRHFCPDDRTTFPFIYPSKAVISDTRAGLRFDTQPGGDACALGGAGELQTNLWLHHYGKMHLGRRAAALNKERSFQELYVDRGFPDPKVQAQWDTPETFDYLKVFDVAYAAGDFEPYTGPHPQYVQSWLNERRLVEAAHG